MSILISEEYWKHNHSIEELIIELDTLSDEDIKNLKDEEDNSIIHYVAKNNQPEILNYLLDRGAYINDLNLSEETPLHLASISDLQSVDILCKRGADTHAITNSDSTPLNYAIINNKLEIVKYYINNITIDLDTINAIQSAIEFDSIEVAIYLIKEGVDLFNSDYNYSNAFYYINQNQEDLINYLLNLYKPEIIKNLINVSDISKKYIIDYYIEEFKESRTTKKYKMYKALEQVFDKNPLYDLKF